MPVSTRAQPTAAWVIVRVSPALRTAITLSAVPGPARRFRIVVTVHWLAIVALATAALVGCAVAVGLGCAGLQLARITNSRAIMGVILFFISRLSGQNKKPVVLALGAWLRLSLPQIAPGRLVWFRAGPLFAAAGQLV